MMNPFDGLLERCPCCKRFLTSKQARVHVCYSPLIDVKEIDVIYFFETQNKNNEKTIISRGYDGVLYRLRQCKTVPMCNQIHNRRFLTERESDEDLTEPFLRYISPEVLHLSGSTN